MTRPIAPWSVPNQICRVALSKVMCRMVFGPGLPTGTSAMNRLVFASKATSVAGAPRCPACATQMTSRSSVVIP